MADKEIGGLTAASLPLSGTESVHGVQGGNSRQFDIANIRSLTKAADLGDTEIDGSNILTLGEGQYFDMTGTQQIDAIATKGVGTVVKLHFDTIRALTHHATNFILPGGVDITTAAGDEAEFVEYATADWRCTSYTRASGDPVVVDGICKAWVIYDHTGTAAITDSFNMTSITDTGTGTATMTWATDFADADYVSAGMAREIPTNDSVNISIDDTIAPAAGTLDITIQRSSDKLRLDSPRVSITAFGQQA